MSIHSFMNQKSFHPTSKANQRKLWIAEQKAKEQEKREKEAQKQFEQEQQRWQHKSFLTMGKNEKFKAINNVSFMYQPPPGYLGENINSSENTAQQIQGHAFGEFQTNNKLDSKQIKAHEQMIQKFEFLKGAPTEGSYTQDINVTYKPFGIELKNIKCIKCGKWGHRSTDRECPLANINRNGDTFRQKIEDPLTVMNSSLHLSNSNLMLKQHVIDSFDPKNLIADPEEESDPEKEFLASLTSKQKKKLLKHLEKL
jgi:CBF1 interacting corepressor